MKTLLRSLFLSDQGDDPQQFLGNHQKFLSSGLGFDVPEYNVLWDYIREFVRAHNHTPNITTLRAHFTHTKEDEILNQIEHLVAIKPLTKGDFETLLNARVDDRRQRIWSEALKEAAVITQTGLTIKEGKDDKILKGPIDSARYLVEKARDVVAPALGGRLSGEVTKDGAAARQEYETVEADPLAGMGQMTFIKQMDVALAGAKRYELWIHAAFTGGMKCLAGDARIFDVSTGRMRTAKDLYDEGSGPKVHALVEGTLGVYQASPLIANGVRAIFKVQTDSGRSVRVSGNHPFLTPGGYVDADKIQTGSWVAVAASTHTTQTRTDFSDAEVKILGYLIGDGEVQGDITFTNSSRRVRQDFLCCLDELGLRPATGTYSSYPSYRKIMERQCLSDRRKMIQTIRVSRSDGSTKSWVSPVRVLLDRTGTYGCGSADKFIPEGLWGCPNEQIWLFLSALWATDGHLDRKIQRGTHRSCPSVWYASISQNLAEDLQRLLQRVGVHSSVSKVVTKVGGEPYFCWYVHVLRRDLSTFLDQITPVGKEVGLGRCRKVLDRDTKYDGGRVPSELLCRLPDGLRIPSRSGWIYAKGAKQKNWVSGWVAARFAQHADCPPEIALVLNSRDIVWEQVRAVTCEGEEQTYDLSVPGPENFVVNGFITHNSTFMLNWAYNQAVVYKQDVLIFSLEMPYSQCRRILYAIHSIHPKFRKIRRQLGLQADENEDVGLPYSNIRDGNLQEWHPKARGFYLDYVIPDFNGDQSIIGHPYWKADYGKIHIEVADPDKQDFTTHDLRSMAEVLYAKTPFQLIFVDHCGLMSPRRHQKDTTANINEVIRDLKKLALGFNRGQGIAVVGLFQISREGYKSALKVKEKTGKAGYNLTHLSYANEAERCVTLDTIVRSPRGFHAIPSPTLQGQTVWSLSGWKTVSQVFHNGIRRVWRMETDRGSELCGSAPHRVRIVADGHLDWKALADLVPGQDYVVSTFGDDGAWPVQSAGRLPHLILFKYETDKGRKGGGHLVVPQQVTPDLAYLLGAWDGDGRVHPRGVAWTGNRKETAVRDHLRACFERTFGHPISLQENPSRPGSFDLVKWSQPLKRWFEEVAGKRADEVPSCILQAPKEIVCAYLRGLFDTDGWVNNQGIVGINMKGACERFLRQVQMLLTALGIDSDLSKRTSVLRKTGNTYPKVLLRVRTQDSTLRFFQVIGFTQGDKQQLGGTRRETCKQVYPVPQTFLSAYSKVHSQGSGQTAFPRSFYNVPARVRRTGLVPRGAVELLVQSAARKGITGEDITFLSQMLNLQAMRVRSIEDTGRDEPVMDLEVDGDHEYQTGPVLSHNSGDIVTAGWIDDDLVAQSRVQFQNLKARDNKPFDTFISRVEWPCRRILTCYEVPRSAEENAKLGADVDKAHKEINEGGA